MRPLLRQIARALVAVLAASLLLLGLTACGGGGDAEHGYSAEFSRAVQVFPGIKVRVLGVDVGHVTGVANTSDGVQGQLPDRRPVDPAPGGREGRGGAGLAARRAVHPAVPRVRRRAPC